MIRIRPITTQEQYSALQTAAQADKHIVLFATHVALDEHGESVGYLSICNTPILQFWAHSKKMHPRDTYMMYQVGESLAASQGCKQLVTPCASDSPLNKFLPQVDYQLLGNTNLHIKQL